VEPVHIFKLSNGEEVIGKVVHENNNTVELADVRVLMIDGSGSLHLGPFMFSHDVNKNVTLNKNLVVGKSENPRGEFEEAYRSSVSKIITTAPSRIITG